MAKKKKSGLKSRPFFVSQHWPAQTRHILSVPQISRIGVWSLPFMDSADCSAHTSVDFSKCVFYCLVWKWHLPIWKEEPERRKNMACQRRWDGLQGFSKLDSKSSKGELSTHGWACFIEVWETEVEIVGDGGGEFSRQISAHPLCHLWSLMPSTSWCREACSEHTTSSVFVERGKLFLCLGSLFLETKASALSKLWGK